VFTTNDLGLSNGGDTDIFWTRSRDLGISWSLPAAIAASFLTDSGVTSTDIQPALASDGPSRMVVWASTKNSIAGNFGIFSAYSSSLATNWVNALPVGNAFASDLVDDNEPCVAGGNGTYVTVWLRNEGGGNRDLYFARTTVNGGPSWSVPARVDATSATDSGSEVSASIATDGAGNWVIVCDSTANHFGSGTDAEIYAYRSSDDGVTWSGPALVNATAASDGSAFDSEPTVAVDAASGTWMCTWRTPHTFSGITGGDSEIAWSKSTNLGAVWQPTGIVNTDYPTDQGTSSGDSEPSVRADQRGHFLVSWTRTLTNDSDTDLRAARTDDLGTTWTAPVFIDIDAALDSGTDAGSALVPDGIGHWLCVWQSNDSLAPVFGTDLDVVASRFLIPSSDFLADFCYGHTEIGSAPRCPCGNDSPIGLNSGCLNASGTGGRIGHIGSFSASAATQVISISGVPPGSAALMFQGDGQLGFGLGTPFGDGRLCVAGVLDRLGVVFAGPTGNGGLNFAPTGVSAGSTRFYQGWYRDSVSFCTSATFNLTSAYGTVWAP